MNIPTLYCQFHVTLKALNKEPPTKRPAKHPPPPGQSLTLTRFMWGRNQPKCNEDKHWNKMHEGHIDIFQHFSTNYQQPCNEHFTCSLRQLIIKSSIIIQSSFKNDWVMHHVLSSRFERHAHLILMQWSSYWWQLVSLLCWGWNDELLSKDPSQNREVSIQA